MQFVALTAYLKTDPSRRQGFDLKTAVRLHSGRRWLSTFKCLARIESDWFYPDLGALQRSGGIGHTFDHNCAGDGRAAQQLHLQASDVLIFDLELDGFAVVVARRITGAGDGVAPRRQTSEMKLAAFVDRRSHNIALHTIRLFNGRAEIKERAG